MKASPKTNLETEIKLAAPDLKDARRRLRAAGFRVAKRRIYEKNTIYDTPGLKLRKAQSLVRVRQVGSRAKMTYKGPPLPGRHKSREELEIDISSAGTMAAILGRLGLRPVFRYAKYRTELRQTSGGGTATLDETPIGTYMELEGSPAWIDRTARKMGYSEADYITASYGGLYLDWCKTNGRKPGDMVFS
jgi:adenylate cyclase, class 2